MVNTSIFDCQVGTLFIINFRIHSFAYFYFLYIIHQILLCRKPFEIMVRKNTVKLLINIYI